MNRCFPVPPPRALERLARGAALLALLGLVGCLQQQVRPQAADESDRERYGVETIGERTTVGNAMPHQVSGVGLVVGLEGTGAEAVRDHFREMLVKQLETRGVPDIKGELSNPNHALVIVSALIPPGACKGDPLDVEVTLPPRSNVQSLRGGYLREAYLFEYATTQELGAPAGGPDGLVIGRKLAVAEGPVLAGMGDGGEEARLKHGRVWGGARCKADFPLQLLLNKEHQFGRVAKQIADRVNVTFTGGPRNAPAGAEIAHAHDNLAIDLRVPAQYRHNLERFVRVARLIPFLDDGGENRPYLHKLADDLLDPARTVTAALRLEALGPNSVPALKTGLESSHPLVRFCAAEAMAYLGNSLGADELALAVRQQPLFRPLALTALASLDEGASRLKLAELIELPLEDEARYGAFHALKTLCAGHKALHSEKLNDSYWLHRVAPQSPPLIHISSTGQAEIVLFGDEPCLKRPFDLMAGPFILRATPDDERCMVIHFTRSRRDPEHRECSFLLADVLHTLAELGANYPEVVAVIQEADSAGCLSCRVRCDALPRPTDVYDLLKAGSGTLELRSEAAPAGPAPAAAAPEAGAARPEGR
jgi:flagellar basal body P-ring protein FlgI